MGLWNPYRKNSIALATLQRRGHVWRLFQLVLLALATGSAAYSRFALSPLQESMRVAMTLSDNQIAWLQGPTVGLPLALASIPIGVLADRYSRGLIIQIFAAINLAAILVTAFAINIFVLTAARAFTGVALAALLVTAYAMAGDFSGPAQRGRATMIVAFGETIGPPAAFAIGGTLLGMDATRALGIAAWRWALLGMTALLALAVLLMMALREPPRSLTTHTHLRLRDVWFKFWGYRAVVFSLLAARIMVWIADGAVLVWGAPTFARRFSLAPDQVGAIMASALLVSGLSGPVLGGLLADLCQRSGGPRRTVTAIAVLAILSVPAALFALMPSATSAAIVLAFFLTIGFTIATMALTVATIVIPGDLRGLYVGVTFMLGATFCVGVAPLVVSGLSVLLGGPAMIGKALAIVCSTTSLAGAAVFCFGRGYFSALSHPSKIYDAS